RCCVGRRRPWCRSRRRRRCRTPCCRPRRPDMGLREAAKQRRDRESTWHMVISDPAEAQRRLKEAKQQAMVAGFAKDGGEAKRRADELVATAEADLAACVFPVRFR